MNADFINQMIALRDLAAPLATGVPTIRSLILQRRERPAGQIMMQTVFVVLHPKPHIATLSPKLAAAFQSSGLTLEIDDFQVRGISRAYGYEELVGTGITYWVDGVLNEEGTAIVEGIACDFVTITHGKTLCWDMILRRKPDE